MLTKTHRSLAVFAATVMVLAITMSPSAPTSAQQASTLKAPAFELDPKWPTIPNNWVLGEVTSISVDRNDHIWVLHVPQSIPEPQRANAAPPVLEFDAVGEAADAAGAAPATGFEWPEREHGIFVDANDFVWIGGRGGWPRPATPGISDDMILKFTMAGKFVMQIGHRGQSKGNTDTENVHQPTDVFVDTQAKEVYVADGYGNKRVIVFDSETGKFKRMWGAFGNPPPPTLRRRMPPRRSRRRLPTARRSSGCRTRSRCRATASSTSRTGSTTAIQMFTTRREVSQAGARDERRQHVVPVPAGFAFSPDAKQQFLYVVDSGPMRVVIFDRATMTQIGAIGMRGREAGDFDIVHHMAADSKGNLYTAEIVTNRRAQRFVLTSK